MMSFNFSVNISTLFNEVPFMERFEEVSKVGLTSVEFQDAYSVAPKYIGDIAKEYGINVSLMNSYQGDCGDFGLAALPGKELEFCRSLNKSLEYMFHTNCKNIHILAGMKTENFSEEDQTGTFINNLQTASDVLEEHMAVGLIEPICPKVKENYFLASFDKAVEILQKVERPNIKLLLDIYHLHMLTGDVMANLDKYYPYAGYIQISQEPNRQEPFAPDGIIKYSEVFNYLKKKNYSGVIGLEYFSTGSSASSIEWVKNYC